MILYHGSNTEIMEIDLRIVLSSFFINMYFSKGLCNEAEVFACNIVKVILLPDEMLGIILILEMVPA